MTAKVTGMRRLAIALMTHAATAIPPVRLRWAEAMRNESEHIESDFEALRWAAGCVFASYLERARGLMDQKTDSFRTIVKTPGAFVPLAMSLTALVMLGSAYIFAVVSGHGGLQREPDEGAIAHLWQLLMAGQLPVLLYFAIKWLPRAPRQTLYVLALQIGAVLAAMAPVFLLHL